MSPSQPNHKRRSLLRAAAASPLLHVLPSFASENWPAKPVTIVSPYNPGGTNDVVARLLADRLQRAFGQPFTVENRAGAAGVIGVQSVIRAKPDGYTLLAGNSGSLVIQSAGRVPSPYDPLRQVAPIMKVVDATQFISVNADLPVKSVGELIAYARKNPGQLNFGSAGVGSFGQFLGEYLKLKTGIDMMHIPSNGSAAALTEMMSGRVQVLIDPQALTQASDPRVRILATLSPRRLEIYPQYPTIIESGGPDLEITGWFGLQGPVGLAPTTIAKIVEVGKSLRHDAEAQKIFNNSALIQSFVSGPAFVELIGTEMQKVAEIRERANIKIG